MLRNDKLVLIQGPPGTGKTSTIIGMLSVLLGRTSSTSITVPNEPSLKSDSKTLSSQPSTPKRMRTRVLVCTPSNAAADELTRRVLNGLVAPDGNEYRPNIIRVGALEKLHPSVRVSLDIIL